MHDDELSIDAALVGALLAEQFPRWGGLPLREVRSTGTVNAIFRLGDELCVRLPRVPAWAADLDRELRWLPQVAPLLSLRVPEPVAAGQPSSLFPFRWAVYRWLDGTPSSEQSFVDEAEAGRDLARFVSELRRIPPDGEAPTGGRRPLAELDGVTRTAIDASAAVIDHPAAIAAWDLALTAPPFDDAAVWIHGDLLRPNLLVNRGRLSAVIDFGSVGVGDPAADVIAAWSVFGDAGRGAFRHSLAVDDDTWNRARGFALHQAAMIIPYYAESNPMFVTLARRTVEQVVRDIAS